MIQSLRFGEELTPEAGRYHLVVSPTCPWCRRVAIARRINFSFCYNGMDFSS